MIELIKKYKHIIIIVIVIITSIILFTVSSKLLAGLFASFGSLFGILSKKGDNTKEIDNKIKNIDILINESKVRQTEIITNINNSTDDIKEITEKIDKISVKSKVNMEDLLAKLNN